MKSIYKQLITFSGLTLISRVLGLAREMLTTYIIGASFITDILIVAFKFPHFFRRFFAEGALQSALVPELTLSIAKDQKQEAFDTARNVFSFMLIFLIFFVLAFQFLAPKLIPLILPGFRKNGENFHYTISLIRITFPYILLISLCAVLSSVLNSFKKFAGEALNPVILNTILIGTLSLGFFLENQYKLGYILSFAILGAGFVQLMFLLIICKKQGFQPFCIPVWNSKLKEILKRMIQGSMGGAVAQINLFIDLCFASSLPSSSLTYLYYADRLYQLPLSIIGISLGVVLLPNFSHLSSIELKHKLVSSSLLTALSIILPAMLGLFVFSEVIISTLFYRGKFTYNDVIATSKALEYYSLGLPAYVMSKIFLSYFFSKKRVQISFYTALVGVSANLVGNIALMPIFGHSGMALATSISAWISFSFLCYIYKTDAINNSAVFNKAQNQLHHTMQLQEIDTAHWTPSAKIGLCNTIHLINKTKIAKILLWNVFLLIILAFGKNTLNLGAEISLVKNVIFVGLISSLGFVFYFGLGYYLQIIFSKDSNIDNVLELERNIKAQMLKAG